MQNKTSRVEDKTPARRRGFLTTLMAGLYGITVLPLLTAVSHGAAPQGGRGGAGGAGGGGGGGAGGGGGPSPAQLATMMIKQFDRDGDRALNQRELMMALVTLQKQRMGGGGGAGGQGGRGGGGAGGKGGRAGGRGGAGGAGGRPGGNRGGGGRGR